VTESLVIRPRTGEIVGDAPDRRIEILCEHDAVHATWSRFGPRREGADLHVHRLHSDLFYVLEGELTARIGPDGEAVAVPAGTLVRVPPLVVHGYRNAGDAEVRFLNLHAPGQGFAPYMRARRDGAPHGFDQEPPPPGGGRPAADASVATGALAVDQPGFRVMLLADVDEIGLAEIVIEPDPSPPQRHVHTRHAESLYVLEGEIAATLDGERFDLEPGTWLTVPEGAPHAFSCTAPARVLSLHTPRSGFGAYLRALQDSGGDVERAAASAGFDRQPAR
jgi:quercetin dioxygenase-like cupin family protein